MTIESISKIVAQSIVTPDLSKLKATDSDKSHDLKKALISLVPYIGDLAAEGLQQYYDYKEDEFFRKFVCYLLGLKDTNGEERKQFAEEIQNKAEDFAGNVILGMVDRLDNIHKQQLFAKITVARIHGFFSVEDFFRLHSLLERIPYVDLKELPNYKEPFYDENGDTELLFATGALELETIDTKGGPNKYKLSRLGDALLKWGFDIHLDLEHGKGTNVELNVLSAEDIEDITSERIKAYRPTFKEDTLYFPDGTKSGELEDDGDFMNDYVRGK